VVSGLELQPWGAIALLRLLAFKVHVVFGVSPKRRNKAIAPYKNSLHARAKSAGITHERS